NSYDAVFHVEEDRVNIMHELELHGSSQQWHGDLFRIAREKTYNDLFELPGLRTEEPVRFRARMALRANVSSRFFLDIGGQTLQSGTAASVNIGSTGEIYQTRATAANIDGDILLDEENVDVTLRYPHPGGANQSSGWLDFIQARARLELRLLGNQLAFRDTRLPANTTATYQLAGADGGVRVWDVTNPLAPIQQLTESAGDQLTFGTAVDTIPGEFVAFRPETGLLTAEAIGLIPNQNLHAITAADMLIIYHPDFQDAAELLAEHRANQSGLNVVLANVFDVYNEFSSGSVDPAAIRNFAKTIFSRDPNFRYLLLFGDGAFDCREIYEELAGSNFIPVFEADAIHELYGYPADDFFGIFNGEERLAPLAYDLSIAVGRLPVTSATQASTVIEKIINYETNPETLKDWRTRMVFVGDDEDSATHSDDADQAAELVRDSLPYINSAKLFFDLFPQESTPAGDFYPVVRDALDQAIFKGSLAVTYLGHGGPRGWAQERVLTIPMIQNWDNEDALPLFITATCTFAAYDDAAFVSSGEELFNKDGGGAIALLTTTRPVFASRNAALTNGSLSALLNRLPDGQWPTLGDVIRQAKNKLSSSTNYDNERKFTLLGDPAMVLALPQYQVATTSINGQVTGGGMPDTLRALDQVTITGVVTDLAGSTLTDFNGTVYTTIFDKRVPASTLQNDPGSPARTYQVQRNILFRGQATVTNGAFSISFVMPQDINYSFGPGKISYYAADPGQRIDAGGSYEEVIIGGANEEGLNDDIPPVVEVFMNSTDFVSGSRVTSDPVLVVSLSDDNGINVSGNSIGHDLEGFLNEDTQNSYLLNDFYEAATDDYTKGEVRFPLRDLPNGVHRMRVRAWDVANNMGEGGTEFIIADDAGIALQNLLNYPNPFTDRTCFQFDTDVAGSELDVRIRIYTISGRLVKTIQVSIPAFDGALRQDDCISWDGRDEYGDQLARGVYLYQVSVRTSDGLNLSGDSEFEKLVILK
ncbi:MAG: type IX secretion system sortase PorU, partial [Lewinella sp.]|nr:type IX secretion system sortase PorU [Lewinella sp.]